MGVHFILVSAVLFLMGALFLSYGALLLFRPGWFLKFHDFVDPGRAWNRAAEWRKHIEDGEYKRLGVFFLLIGLVLLFVLIRVLLNPQSVH